MSDETSTRPPTHPVGPNETSERLFTRDELDAYARRHPRSDGDEALDAEAVEGDAEGAEPDWGDDPLGLDTPVRPAGDDTVVDGLPIEDDADDADDAGPRTTREAIQERPGNGATNGALNGDTDGNPAPAPVAPLPPRRGELPPRPDEPTPRRRGFLRSLTGGSGESARREPDAASPVEAEPVEDSDGLLDSFLGGPADTADLPAVHEAQLLEEQSREPVERAEQPREPGRLATAPTAPTAAPEPFPTYPTDDRADTSERPAVPVIEAPAAQPAQPAGQRPAAADPLPIPQPQPFPQQPPAPHQAPHQAPQQAPQQSGQQSGQPDPTVPRFATASDFLDRRPHETPAGVPTWGWQGAVARLSGGAITPRMSVAEAEHVEHRRAMQRSFDGPRTIVFANPKGGSGTTTGVLMAGNAFGSVRGGGVVAWDSNETRGTLGIRGRREDTARTTRDLLDDVERFNGSARIGDLSAFVRSQGDAHFDVLAADERPEVTGTLDATGFGSVHALLQRFFRVIIVDTGANVRADNWLAAVAAADLLVVTSTVREDTGYTGLWMLDALDRAGHGELARNAVTVLSDPVRRVDKGLAAELGDVYEQRTRVVHRVPFDPALASGATVPYADLSTATQRAWIAACGSMAVAL